MAKRGPAPSASRSRTDEPTEGRSLENRLKIMTPGYDDAAALYNVAGNDGGSYDALALNALDLADRWADAGDAEMDAAALAVYRAAGACSERYHRPEDHERHLAELEGALGRLEALASDRQAELERASDHRMPF